ncbi:MAG: tail fiber domain-containing protein [Vicinamibacterales bacterium]
MRIPISVSLVLAILIMSAGTSAGQTLGTFRWQMQPHCNVLTVTVTQAGGVYRIEGSDDQCGGGRDRASVAGLAFPNPDGGIGMGLTIVTSPGGIAVHVDAEIAIAGLSGTWRTASGGSGPFVFTPGAAVPGDPRPAPAAAIPPAISLLSGGSILARPDGDSGIPTSGAGTRMMWYAGRGALRAGAVGGGQWDDANIGHFSAAFGQNTIASGRSSVALGGGSTAAGTYSAAFGEGTQATGTNSVAFGWNSAATGTPSLAAGTSTTASGISSTAFGSHTVAAGADSIVGGFQSSATGRQALAFGDHAAANGDSSIALGRSALTIPAASGSFVFADNSSATPFGSLGPNGFNVRAAGGFQFFTNAAASLGAALQPNATDWSVLSDVNVKHQFRELDGDDVLGRIARMPVTEWSYKAQDPGIRHIGPTAQDFHAAFGLGQDPLRIGTLDADGVALAGVKALEARTRALQDEVEALRRRLDAVLATPLRER